jgi:hypothetical protein
VIVDGVEYPRTLVDMDTASTEVWVPITFAPMKSVAMSVAASSSSPADAASWAVADGESLLGWPERGWFLIETEAVWYGARTDTEFLLIDRGARATTAAAHAADTVAYWVEHDIQILYGMSSAANPPVPSFAISVGSSSNTMHRYSTDFAALDHAPTTYYGQMLPRYTEDNIKAPFLSLGENNNLGFYDIEPGGLLFPYNNAELYVPCGVESGTDKVSYTVSGTSSDVTGSDIVLDLRVFGTDINPGVERLLATYKKSDRGGSETLSPDAVLQRLRFNALYVCVIGAVPQTDNNVDLDNDGLHGTVGYAQRFTLTQPCALINSAFKIKENTSGDTRGLQIMLGLADPTDPDDDDELFNASIANSEFTTSYTWVQLWTSAGTRYVVPAGEYDMMLFGGTAGAGTIFASDGTTALAAGKEWTKSTAWTSGVDQDFAFLIIGDGDHIEEEAPTGLGGSATFDTIDIELDNTTPRTPLIVLGAEENIMVLRGTLAHNTTGQTFTFNDYVMKISDTLTIDCKNKTIALNSAINQYAPGAITFSDQEQWMHFLATGVTTDNRLVYTDATIAGGGAVNVGAAWYPVWA